MLSRSFRSLAIAFALAAVFGLTQGVSIASACERACCEDESVCCCEPGPIDSALPSNPLSPLDSALGTPCLAFGDMGCGCSARPSAPASPSERSPRDRTEEQQRDRTPVRLAAFERPLHFTPASLTPSPRSASLHPFPSSSPLYLQISRLVI